MSRNLKSSLRCWVGKVFKGDNKTKKFMAEVARKIGPCDQKQSRLQLEDIIANDLTRKIQNLKQSQAPIEELHCLVRHFLEENSLKITAKLSQDIQQLIDRFYNNHEEFLAGFQEEIENVITQDHYDCICPKITKDLQVSERTQQCYRCRKDCHTNCLWPAEDNNRLYQCPLCFLKNCMPNRKVTQVLFGGYLRQTKKEKIEYIINLPPKQINFSDTVIQARCARLNRQKRYEISWPQHCSIYLNNKRLQEYRPLPTSTSQKRRNDEEVVLDKKVLTREQNILRIQQKHQYLQGTRNANYCNHFVIISAVCLLSVHEVQRNLSRKHLSEEYSKYKLREYMNRGFQESCYTDRLKITLTDHFYGFNIKIPVRSKHCQFHYQAFDLESFIKANLNTKMGHQKWKCPLCKQRAYDLEIDDYLLNIIEHNPHLNEIEFNRDGYLQLSASKLVDKEPPEQITNTGEINQSQQLKFQTSKASKPIKRQSKPQIEQHYQQIQDYEQNNKVSFKELIQIKDDDQDLEKAIKPKRTYSSRHRNQVDMLLEIPRKKQKKEDYVNKEIIYEDSNSVLQIPREQFLPEVSEYQEDLASKFSDEEFNSKTDKKKKGKKTVHKDKNQLDDNVPAADKNVKTLNPSPAIRTVIPEAIRISDVKLPQPKRVLPQQSIIEIDDSEQDNNPEIRKSRKIQHHLQELDRQRRFLSSRNDRSQITQRQKSMFMLICQNWLVSTKRT